MSQLDLIAELRAHRPVAPSELRARVRDLAATAPAPRRRFTWRRALVVASRGGRTRGRRRRARDAQHDGDSAETGAIARIAHEKPAATRSPGNAST